MNDIKTVRKVVKNLKEELEEYKNYCRIYQERNSFLEKSEREIGDMLTEARDQVHFLKEILDRDTFDINTHLELSIENDKLMRILKITKRTYNSKL